MKTNIVIDISPLFSYLGKFCFSSHGAKILFVNQIAGFFILKKEANKEVYFWYAYKHASFLHVDTIILGVLSQAYAKYLKYKICIFAIAPKNVGNEVNFCLQINTEIFYKLIITLWVI